MGRVSERGQNVQFEQYITITSMDSPHRDCVCVLEQEHTE